MVFNFVCFSQACPLDCLNLKAPIMTAADVKFCDDFPNFGYIVGGPVSVTDLFQ